MLSDQRPNASGSNFVSTSDAVYVAYREKCLRLDPDTGRIVAEFALPSPRTTWGWIGVVEDVLLGGGEPVEDRRAPRVAAGGFEDLASIPVALRVGVVALFCVVVTFLASEVQGLKKLAVKLSSTLDREIDRVESDEGLISEFSPVLSVLSLEGILEWTARAAHAVGGGSYAHVAALAGNHHRTVMEGDFDSCPSWWHPEIQRLVLQCCRGGETVRMDTRKK